MQVDFDLAEPGPAQLGQDVQVFRFVLLLRVKERVPRRTSVRITEPGAQPGVVLGPAVDTSAGDVRRGAAQLGLVVVADAEQQVDRLSGPDRLPPTGLDQVWKQPPIEGSAAELPVGKGEAQPETGAARRQRYHKRVQGGSIRQGTTLILARRLQ